MKQILLTILLLLSLKNSVAKDYSEDRLFIRLKKAELSLPENKKLLGYLSKQNFSIARAFRMQELSDIYIIKGHNAAEFVDKIAAVSQAKYVERVPVYHTSFTPNDPSYSTQWHLQKIQADLAWNLSQGSNTVKVAVTDDGFLLSHQDLQSQWWINSGEIAANGIDDDNNGYIDDWRGWDVADADNDPSAVSPTNYYWTHGTHVAGIVSAATNNNIGIAGIGYHCKIIPVKCTNVGGGVLTHTYEALEYAIAAKPDVINMSWGGGGYSATYQLLFDIAYSRGILCVAAAGNSNAAFPFFPAAYNHVIAVAASDFSDQKASFSNFGSYVDVTAPGDDIYSTLAGGNNQYGNLSGTSMAAPLVSGLCALMRSYNTGMDIDSIEHCLKSTCDNIDAQNSGYIGQLGAGRINALKALQCASSKPIADFSSDITTQCTGKTIQYNALPSGVTPFTYLWTFQGGTPATSTLANPTVTYNTNGVYTVTLIVNNPFGADTLVRSGYITIQQPSAILSGNLPNLASATAYLTINISGGNPPFNITISNGTNSFTQNNVTQNPFLFPVSPSADTTNYVITAFSANGCTGSYSGTARVIKRKGIGVGGLDLNCLRVKSHTTIAKNISNFSETTTGRLGLGIHTSSLGDWDNDGIKDILVGAPYFTDPSTDAGALYLIKLNANGTVKNHNRISSNANGFNAILSSNDIFGTGNCVIGDLDNDGVNDIASRKNYGHIFIIFMNSNGTVKSSVLLGNGMNGVPNGLFKTNADFAYKITAMGDLNNDGAEDIAVCCSSEFNNGFGRGSVYILFLNTNGTLKSFKQLGSGQGVNGIDDNDYFGYCEFMGDINGDGLKELAVGAPFDDDSGTDKGAFYILSLDNSGNVINQTKINSSNIPFSLSTNSYWGQFISNIGDYDRDGISDLAVTASGEYAMRGTVYILLMNSNLTVKKTFRLTRNTMNFNGNILAGDNFGEGTINVGDLDNNGFDDFAIGSHLSDIVGADYGAVWILFMEDTCQQQNITCPPNVSLNYSKCKHEPLNLLARSGTNYSWSPSTGLSSTTIRNPVCNADTTVTYLVSYLDTNGCNFTDTVKVVVKSAIPYVKLQNINLCMGDTTQLSIPANSTNILWSPNLAISNTTIFNPSFYPVATQQYYVQFRDANGCLQQDSALITVATCCNARARFSVSDSVVCYGDSVSFINQSLSSLPATYIWKITGSTTTTYSGAALPNQLFTAPFYKVKLVVNNGSCSDSIEKNIYVVRLSVNAGRDTSICVLTNLQLGETGNADWTYNWTPSAGLSNPSIANPLANLSVSRQYILHATDNITGCSASDTVSIFFNSNIDSNAISQTICEGDSFMFNGSYLTQSGTYIQTDKNGLGCDSAITILTLNVYSPTIVNRPAIVGCDSLIFAGNTYHSDTVLSNVIPSVIGCDSMIYNQPLSVVKLRWVDSIVSGCEKVIINGKEYDTSAENVDSVLLKSTTQCDSIKIRFSAIVYTPPIVEITADQSNPVNFNDTVLLTATPGYTYLWNYNQDTAQQLTYLADKDYVFTVIATDEHECTTTANYQLIVNKNTAIGMPTAFTPNNDGVNDYFYPVIFGNITIEKIIIYNRWGERVFDGKGTERWDGTYKRKDCPISTYVYFIEYIENDKKKKLSGNVTILR